MADLPLDQYCAFLEQTNDGTEQESILTLDANLVLESANQNLLETKTNVVKTEDTSNEPNSKKIKLEEFSTSKQDVQIDSIEPEKNEEDLEEGELEDGEIHKDEVINYFLRDWWWFNFAFAYLVLIFRRKHKQYI